MAAGKAAAARLRQAGRAGEEEEDLEDSATAFEDDLAEGESSAPLAAVSAVATPLPRRDSAARPMLQREGQISTHLFHVELPSESPLSSRVRARLTARVSGAAAAEDVSLGRAVLRWRRQAAAGATPAPAGLVATSSCDLPVLTPTNRIDSGNRVHNPLPPNCIETLPNQSTIVDTDLFIL